MGYELYVLPVPPGGDLEDAAEALLALLRAGHLRQPGRGDAAERAERVATALELIGGLSVQPADTGAPTWRRLQSSWGLVVTVSASFVRFQVPFDCVGDEARQRFVQLFELLARVVEETHWTVYDPQDANGVSVDADGRQATLEIFLSVMDQLRPGRTPA